MVSEEEDLGTVDGVSAPLNHRSVTVWVRDVECAGQLLPAACSEAGLVARQGSGLGAFRNNGVVHPSATMAAADDRHEPRKPAKCDIVNTLLPRSHVYKDPTVADILGPLLSTPCTTLTGQGNFHGAYALNV